MALLDDLRREVRQRGERIGRAGAIALQAELRETGPEITGNLNRKTTVRIQTVGTIITVEAVADTEYAAPVIRGARPHVIRAKKPGGYLRFPDQGGVFIFRHSVNHPGSKPNPYWDTAMRRWGRLLQAAADRLR
jgi:hypothetical protein